MILIEPAAPKPPQWRAISKRELSSFLAQARKAIGLKGYVTVLLTTDNALKKLNREFRRKNKTTDVLSFPSTADSAPTRTRMAGDLAISLDTATRQAAAFGHPLRVEVKILMVHGLLHLAGFDHETDTGQMARKERALRKQFALPSGLIQRSGGEGKP